MACTTLIGLLVMGDTSPGLKVEIDTEKPLPSATGSLVVAPLV